MQSRYNKLLGKFAFSALTSNLILMFEILKISATWYLKNGKYIFSVVAKNLWLENI